jgi:hypothetical protein
MLSCSILEKAFHHCSENPRQPKPSQSEEYNGEDQRRGSIVDNVHLTLSMEAMTANSFDPSLAS